MENLEQDKSKDPFYDDAAHYWEKIPATVDGMLGGFGFISQTDIQGSKTFLQQLFRLKNGPGKTRALDCGAGIGRITKNLLIHIFDHVDMVEQNPIFLEQASKFIGSVHKDKLGSLYPVGLQNFIPDEEKYDVIWCQWVLGHLRDDDFVEFFDRCKQGLKRNGLIIVKENITSGTVEVDKCDSSVTRPLRLIRRLFKKASLEIIKETEQTNFPMGLYSVRMFALKPLECLEQRNDSNISENDIEVSKENVENKK